MIEQFYDLRPEVLALDRKALDLCRAQFAHVEEIRDYNQLKMLRAFTDCGVEARHFWGSSGYGVWDDSRNKLEEVFARCMGAEAALVRPQFMSGTHTLTVALFGLLRTGDTLLAATGRPYDTLEGVIGIGNAGKGCGTLREFGVNYDECPLLPDFTPDYDLIAEKAKTATVVHIQRSRGYTQRNAFDLATIQKVADTARRANPNAVIFVDNCYGEFTQTAEPVSFGADIMAGSFIKNPGGGITPTGGYIAGRRDLVEKCSHRFTAPGIGGDLGCTQDSLRPLLRQFIEMLYQGEYVRHRDLSYYASHLCITPHYLSEICKKVGGEPASYWIDRFTLHEVIRCLNRKELPLTEIVERMNFSSLSYFSRYVQKRIGVSPSEYRSNRTSEIIEDSQMYSISF